MKPDNGCFYSFIIGQAHKEGMHMFSLKGKTALITGGGRGIGYAIAQTFASQGASLYISGRNRETLDEAAARITKEHGVSVTPLCFDVMDKDAVRQAVATVGATGSGPDILVNNAGVNLRGPIETMPEETWDTVIDTNLKGMFLMSQAVFPAMKEKGGKIINISSLMAEIARPGISPYCAAKGGVRQLTKAMAVEWAPHNIQVNAIAPGFIATEMNTALMNDPAFNDQMMRRLPAKRWGKPEDLGACAVFLASSAADYVSGQTITVDGGFLVSF